MGRIGFIEHKGKRMMRLDFSHSGDGRAIFGAMDEAKQLISKEPPNSVLTVTDVTGAHYDGEMAAAMKEFTAFNKPYVKAAAVVGVTGLLKILYSAVVRFSGRQLVLFDDLEAAKEWLATR
ncbi:MAG TPA: hypothetical protein VGL40_13675 [Bacillota bacterium]|jgi:hypothetical protein